MRSVSVFKDFLFLDHGGGRAAKKRTELELKIRLLSHARWLKNGFGTNPVAHFCSRNYNFFKAGRNSDYIGPRERIEK